MSKIDSHANTIIVGDQCMMLKDTSIACIFNPFANFAGILERVSIVDAEVDSISYSMLINIKHNLLPHATTIYIRQRFYDYLYRGNRVVLRCITYILQRI